MNAIEQTARECAERNVSRLIQMGYCTDQQRALIAGELTPIILDALTERYETELLAKLKELNARFDAQVASDCWIPVSERLPEQGHHVIAYSPTHGIGVEYRFLICGRREWTMPKVTHWQPLPNGPLSDGVKK